MSAVLTYRLAVRSGRKKKENTNLRPRQGSGEKKSRPFRSSLLSRSSGQSGSALTTLRGSISEKDAKRGAWKDERRCCEEMDILSSSRTSFHIEFHSHNVDGNILFSFIVSYRIQLVSPSHNFVRNHMYLAILLKVWFRGILKIHTYIVILCSILHIQYLAKTLNIWKHIFMTF